jgi:hypothetical protein
MIVDSPRTVAATKSYSLKKDSSFFIILGIVVFTTLVVCLCIGFFLTWRSPPVVDLRPVQIIPIIASSSSPSSNIVTVVNVPSSSSLSESPTVLEAPVPSSFPTFPPSTWTVPEANVPTSSSPTFPPSTLTVPEANVPSPPSLSPSPAAVEPIPRLLEAGELCTCTVEQFAIINPSCSTTFNATFCTTRRDRLTDQSCIRETCTEQLADNELDLTQAPHAEPDTFDAQLLVHIGSNISLIAMMQRFVFDNWPPPSKLPAQPIAQDWFFTDDNYTANQSFNMKSSSLIVLTAIAHWNYLMMTKQATSPASVINSIVYVPSRCLAVLGNIPWLQGNNVTFLDVFVLAYGFLASVKSPGSINFQDTCYYNSGSRLCLDLIPVYYSTESLGDFNATPSLYGDIATLLQVFLDEFKDCQAPKGCLGL